jgi:glycosyltransferase involved in cell wall biosynthesis
MRYVYDRFDHVLAVSDAVRDNLALGGVNPSRLDTLYLGLLGERERDDASRRESRANLGIPRDAVVVACIAFAAPVKGVDILLNALRRVAQTHRDVYLLQVGVEQTGSSLNDLASELGVGERVVWVGVIDDGWRLLSAADVYAQPSRSEGLPFAVMEAMAMGLPIVATDVGGVSEAVIDGETGFLCMPDPVSLASALERMLADPGRWDDLGARGLARYQAIFDGTTSVDRLVRSVYQLPAPRD